MNTTIDGISLDRNLYYWAKYLYVHIHLQWIPWSSEWWHGALCLSWILTPLEDTFGLEERFSFRLVHLILSIVDIHVPKESIINMQGRWSNSTSVEASFPAKQITASFQCFFMFIGKRMKSKSKILMFRVQLRIEAVGKARQKNDEKKWTRDCICRESFVW